MLGNFLYGQSIVKGIITDSIGTPIPSANIYLKNKETKSIIAFAYSDDKGKYKLKVNEEDEFVLSFSALGYGTKDVVILLKESTLLTKNIVLNTTSYDLDEVIISTEKAISKKKDTIVFNASSFKQGEESVVQDLIKKLPGVEVTDTGVIKVDGQEIEKVMVEGDDFFKKGYRLLTKNLDVNAVSKVEVLRRYSNNRLLKGIEESEKVALNLKLDENFKRDWFGRIKPGYGLFSENTYDVQANLSSFGRKNKYFLLGSLNNIGDDVSNDIQGLIGSESNGEPGEIGLNQLAKKIINLNATVPGLKESRTNFNNAELISLNSIFKISEKFDVKVLGLFNSDDNRFFSQGFETFLVGQNNFTNTESDKLNSATNIGFGRVELDYDISKNTILNYEGKWNYSDIEKKAGLSFNDESFNENLDDRDRLNDHKIKYTKRLNDNEVFIISGRYSQGRRSQNYGASQFLFNEFISGSVSGNNVEQLVENKFNYGGFLTNYLNRRSNGNLWDIKLGYEIRSDQLDSQLFIKSNDEIISSPEDYSNDITYKSQDFYTGLGFLKKFNDVDIGLNIEGHMLLNDLNTSTKKMDESPFFVNTKLNFNWKINKRNRLVLYAQNNNTNIGIEDIYNGTILSDYRIAINGTGSFNQLKTNTLFAGYNLGNFGDRFIAKVSLLYLKENDFLSTNSTITPNASLLNKIVIDDREFFSATAKLEKYLGFVRNNLKLKFNYSLSDFKNVVNADSLRSVDNENFTYGFELRSGFRGFFNYHLGSTYKVSKFVTETSNTAIQNISFLDLTFMINSKLNIQLQSERYYFDNIQNGNKDYYFMDFELNYTPKNRNVSFSLIGNNLLNTNTFRNFTVSDTYISSVEYRLLPRYLLLKANLKF